MLINPRQAAMSATGNLPPHAVILPSPGMGHLIPLAELAKRLVLCSNLTATLVTSSTLPPSFLSSLPSSISTLTLPPAPLNDLSTDAHIVTRISLTMTRSAPQLRSILLSLKKTTSLTALIVDFFGSDTLQMAEELGVPRYVFFTSNFFALSFTLHFPALYERTTCEFRDLSQPLMMPGCLPLKGEEFVEPVQDRKSQACEWMVHHARHLHRVDGILVNSFQAMEPGPVEVLQQGKPRVWPIGPFTWIGSEAGPEGPRDCMEWLDQQPGGSVLFVCFGSGGTLSCEQTIELANGLEMSGQRFLWVLRAPCDTDSSNTYFSLDGTDDDVPLRFLPEGFIERTKERGLLVPSWAPQRDVLAHSAIRGFVSHCGWNSTLESLVNGVPMIAWPLYSEQKMNAILLVEGTGVALRPEAGKDRVVRREEVAKVVRELMEGERGKGARQKMKEMQEAAARALEKEGPSYKAMEKVVGIFKATITN